jgi:hypothetical protein
MDTYEALLIHQIELRYCQTGQEDTTLPGLPSASSDAGIHEVIHDLQADPATYQIQTAGAWAGLRGRLGQTVAVLSFAARPWAAGSQSAAASVVARELLGEAQP